MTAPIRGAACTCQFGVRGPWAAGYHTGRDYRARTRLPVVATRGGTVVYAGWWDHYGPDYGLHVVIQTGGVQHLYAHLSSARVRKGQVVREGQQIGVSGATGRTFGPHLHYEERTAPYRYRNHRRPQFDVTTAIPAVSAQLVTAVMRRRARVAHGALIKRELADVVGRGTMNLTNDVLGFGTRVQVRKLQRRWYPKERPSGILGRRALTRLGNRRSRWRTTT